MYKSGKNWMVAGLMTTAVLAGLTLSNGNVVAHADTATAATTTQVANKKQEVSQDQYDAQKAKVATDQTNVNNAQKAVDNAKNANENAAKVNDAKTAWKNAESDYNKANSDYNNAHKATGVAKAAADEANAYKNNWDKDEADLYNKLQNQISDATATKTAQTKVANDEAAKAKKDDAAYDATAKLQAEAQANLDKVNADKKATEDQKQDAADYNQSLLDQMNALYQDSQKHKAARDAANAKVAAVDKTIRNANKILAPKSDKNPAGRDLLGHKSAADSAAAKQAAYETALQHEKDLKAIRDAARWTANQKKDAYTQARADYNLPNDAEYAEMQKKATGARQKINADKADPAYTAVTDTEGHVKDANKVLNNAKKAVDAIQAKIDTQNDKLAKAQADLDVAKAAAASLMGQLAAAKQNVTDRTNALNWWNKKLDDAKANARYQKLVNDIAYRQSIIDKADHAKANRAAAKGADDAVAPLEAALAQKQSELKTYTDALNADTNILNNMFVKGTDDNKDNGDHNTTGKDTKNNGDDTKTPASSVDGDKTTTGVKEGNSAKSNASQVAMTRAEYRAANKVAAANEASAKNTKNDAKLPQTSNNESTAAIALGAVSAMLGLGLVAKKREF